jgi:exodeoxyribonuclease-3
MRLLSFNVNGIRAAKERVLSCIATEQPDIVCLQETKTSSATDLDFLASEYPYRYLHAAKRKGYSGVALLSKTEPLQVSQTFEGSEGTFPFLEEGRILTAEFSDWYVVNVYVPNSKAKLERLEERLVWEEWIQRHLNALQARKPVLYCGDLNVCHTDLDYWSPKPNPKTPGLSPQEKVAMTTLLGTCDLVDSFRYQHPAERGYSYWSPWANSKGDNKGWRLDYILVSRSLVPNIATTKCLDTYCTSDHGPILLDLH